MKVSLTSPREPSALPYFLLSQVLGICIWNCLIFKFTYHTQWGYVPVPALSLAWQLMVRETQIPELSPGLTGQTLGLCLTNSELLHVLYVCSHGLECLPPSLGWLLLMLQALALGCLLQESSPESSPSQMNCRVLPKRPMLFSVTALIVLDDTSLFTCFIHRTSSTAETVVMCFTLWLKIQQRAWHLIGIC